MSAASSNIRVFVTFKESTVFAGEDVEAIITFKSVVPKRPTQQRPGLITTQPNGKAATSVTPSQPTLSRNPSIASHVKKPSHLNTSRHRPTISLNIVDNASTASRGPASVSGGVNIAEPSPRTSKHARSVSIVSLGSEKSSHLRGSQPSQTPQRPGFRHARSASAQVPSPTGRLGRSPSLSARPTLSSPLSGIASPRFRSAESYFLQRSNQYSDSPLGVVSPAGGLPQTFQFPPAPKRPLNHRNATVGPIGHSKSHGSVTRPLSPVAQVPKDPTRLDTASPVHRVLSMSSDDGTTRSSGDFYTLSNRSDETLASEYQPQQSSRLLQRPAFNRSPSGLNPRNTQRPPETLMMGYAQMSGSFVLDGSLVNVAPFEEVKRKAVVGGQGGGGVVGVEQKKLDGGLFGSFGWGNIGESLGGLLRGGEQSSIKEMKSIATSRSIPLLSTPKSLLFVDLKLAPGESRSYSYTFALPRGLPPSHRGRAIKIIYHLVIGTQRPSSSKTQQIRQVEIPLRVFCGVNSQGDILGHDLMTPYIILKDTAKASALDQSPLQAQAILAQHSFGPAIPASSEADFTSYIGRLLASARDPNSNTLLSPTGEPDDLPLSPSMSLGKTTSGRSLSATPLPSSRTLVDHALRLAANSSKGLPTSFIIARSSQTIATLTLSRPALRLGDTLHLALDFSAAAIPCYAIDVSLETRESIDPSLAIRSASSVERATRHVWDKRTELGFTLGWCGRWGGRLKVPWTATPTFETTGVSCAWFVRVEIVVGVDRDAPSQTNPSPDDDKSLAAEDEQHTSDNDAATSQTGSTDADADADADPEASASDRDADPNIERGDARALAPGAAASAPNSRRSSSTTRRHSAQLARKPKPKPLDRAKLLLEDIGADERGRHLIARQRLLCESFEICVPLRVFGASGGVVAGRVDGEGIGTGEEGLAI